jgi:hypothetical protein
MMGGSQALISGHPEYCPEPTLVAIAGSTWGGSMLKQRFVGRGMRLEFCHPKYSTPIVTSCVEDIQECPKRPIFDGDDAQQTPVRCAATQPPVLTSEDDLS